MGLHFIEEAGRFMTCERMAKGDSLLHEADPRVKVIIAILLSMEVVFLNSLLPLLVALASAVVMLAFTGIERGLLLRRILLINIFVALLWAVIPWSTPGRTVISIGPLNATSSGLLKCLFITLKCNTIVMFNISLLSTSSIFALSHALDHLKVPSVLVQLFFFSWRYLHVLEEEYTRITRAALLRGFKPGTNILTYRTYANVLGTLFVRGYDRGQRVYWAMACRGFDGTFWLLSHFKLKATDFFLISWSALLSASLLFLDWSSK